MFVAVPFDDAGEVVVGATVLFEEDPPPDGAAVVVVAEHLVVGFVAGLVPVDLAAVDFNDVAETVTTDRSCSTPAPVSTPAVLSPTYR